VLRTARPHAHGLAAVIRQREEKDQVTMFNFFLITKDFASNANLEHCIV